MDDLTAFMAESAERLQGALDVLTAHSTVVADTLRSVEWENRRRPVNEDRRETELRSTLDALSAAILQLGSLVQDVEQEIEYRCSRGRIA